MLKLLRYLKPYIFQILITLFLIWVQVYTTLRLPNFTAKIINQGIVGGNNTLIMQTGAQMLGITLIGAVATILSSFLASKIATGYARDVRRKVFEKVETFSMKEFDKFSTASLITRSTNDIQQVQTVIFIFLRMVVAAPITAIGAVGMAINTAPSMSWTIGLGVAAILVLITAVFVIALPKFQKLQQLIDRLNLVTRENLTGLRVIRAFNREKQEEQKFDHANTDLTAVNLFVNRVFVVMQPVMMLVFNFTAIGIIWVGVHFIDNGTLNIGNMLAFLQYAMQVLSSFLMLSVLFIFIPRATVSSKRVAEVLSTRVDIKDPPRSKKFSNKLKGQVEFKDVTFAYPQSDTPVLSNISFEVSPGETTAIIGGTGSGKSTLVNLIPRFYDVTEGQVLVDGIDVRNVKQKDLHDRIGFVPQRGVLFSGTVQSNIKYGAPQAGEKDVKRAAKIAQATEFISHLDGKYEARIAQGGTNVSGGQKQRLAIARAIIKKPEIYIFDDSFSALDFKTDATLRQALTKATKGSTVIIVTQRISTIMNSDKIIVIDEGKVVGIGKHNDLLKTNKVYKEMALSQLSEEEINI